MTDLEKKIYANQQIKEKEYWLNKFADINTIGSFPFDVKQSESNSLIEEQYSTYNFELDIQLSNEIKKLSKGNDERLHVILTASVLLLLQHYTSDNNSFVGIPIKKESLKNNIINTALPISVLYEKEISLRAYLSIVRNIIIEATNNQNYPIDLLSGQIGAYNNHNEPSLFDVVVMLNGLHNLESISDFNCSTFFCFKNEESNIGCDIRYNTSKYSIGTIERISKNFKYILEQLYCHDLDRPLKDIEYICKEEKQQLLYEFNDTQTDYPKDKTIHQLFEEQVERTPNSVAVITREGAITYRELNERSNVLTNILLNNGCSLKQLVGIVAERSINTIIGIIAILKTGSAYVPIATSLSENRLEAIIKNAKINLLLRPEESSISSNEIVAINIYENKFIDKNETSVNCEVISSDLAYVIYTSGSTGEPKGVKVEHRSVVNLITFFVKEYSIDNNSRIFQTTAFTWDPSLEDIFGSLIAGGSFYIADKQCMLDIDEFLGVVDEYGITMMNTVPSLLKELLKGEKIESLKTVISAGESLDKSLKESLLAKGYCLYNNYGPTETTVDCLSDKCLSSESISLGKPIANTKVYILDKYNKMVPLGVTGEMCIAGDCLTRGYLGDEILTSEKFITFYGERIYKTGDLARWLPYGKIEFLGRIDHQVKIRGFRIELGEVESVLLKHENIKASIVLACEENGDKYLCAYIVCNNEFNQDEIRSYLSLELPDYMVPTYFVELESLPLTSNGKVNRKALPSPEIKASEDYVAPSNEIEEQLVAIWSEVLNIEKEDISVQANFFTLGGHSLKAMALVSKINKEFNLVIPLVRIFENPTISRIAMTVFNLIEQEENFEEIEI